MSQKFLLYLVCPLMVLSGRIDGQRRDPLEYIRILESAERVKKLKVDQVIAALDLDEGERVADLGAGSGLFTRPMAREVGPAGTVFAIDISKEMLSHVSETAVELKLFNIQTVLASELDPQIPEPVDLVLICDTLHQIREPGPYLQNLTHYIRPSGRVAVIDYQNHWPSRLENLRFDLKDLDRWMSAAGFIKEEQHFFLEDNFFVIYRYDTTKD
jgi:ubiquinone/menaquinone biosynthesis C-methylase UbiE